MWTASAQVDLYIPLAPQAPEQESVETSSELPGRGLSQPSQELLGSERPLLGSHHEVSGFDTAMLAFAAATGSLLSYPNRCVWTSEGKVTTNAETPILKLM